MKGYKMSMIKSEHQLKQLFKNINDNNDLLYISLAVMSVFKHRNAYTDIADMSLIMDIDSFLNLVDVYGGKTITIPTKEELIRICNTVILFYEKELNGATMQSAYKKYGITNDRAVHYDIGKLRKMLSSLKVPGKVTNG